MLRITTLLGSHLVTLPDYQFTPEDISSLETLSFEQPRLRIRVIDEKGRERKMRISTLLVDRQSLFSLNASLVRP